MAAVPSNLSNQDAALKDYYRKYDVINETFKSRPLLAMMSKDENAIGRRIPMPFIYGNPQGTSSTFAKALSNQTQLYVDGFYITRVPKYTISSVTGELIAATKSDIGAFLKEATATINASVEGHMQKINLELYGDGTGSIGQVASISSLTITLTVAADTRRFEVGMTIVGCATLTGGTPSATPGVVTAVDYNAGTVTVSALPTGLTTNWYIFVDGDYGAAASGLKAIFPITAPGPSDSFWGVNRSVSPVRMAGNRLVATGAPISEALTDLASLIDFQGGKPDIAIVNTLRYYELSKELQGQVRYENVALEGEGNIMFSGIALPTPFGVVKVLPDSACDYNLGYMLQLNTLTILSAGSLGNMIDDDGLSMLRVSDADQVQVRIRSYWNIGCKAPAYNGVVQF